VTSATDEIRRRADAFMESAVEVLRRRDERECRAMAVQGASIVDDLFSASDALRKAGALREFVDLASLAVVLDEIVQALVKRAGDAHLPPDHKAGKVVIGNHMLTDDARARKNVAISRSVATKGLARACQAKGLTIRGLAKELDISHGSLIAYDQGRPAPARVFDYIKTRLGYELPGGRA
jgi:hypothetical protein